MDKHIFHNLEQSATKRFDLAAALAKSRSPINVLQSAFAAGRGTRTSEFASVNLGANIVMTSVLQCSQMSWKEKQMLLPTVGLFASLLEEMIA